MTQRSDWHPGEGVLQAYVCGDPDPALAASTEAHLLTCAACRRAVAPGVPSDRLAGVLAGLEDRLDTAGRPWTERLLLRLGIGEADVRVLLAAPSTRRAWWLAVLLALALAILAALQDASRVDALLLFAPLLPVVTTAAAYAPRLDPAWELTAATPYPAMRLLLLRAGAVAATSTLLAMAVAVALPVGLTGTLVWLLPASALTTAGLALSSWVDAVAAAALCCAGWLAAVWTVARGPVDPLAIYDLAGQLASAAVLAAALLVLVRHHHRFDPGSPA